MAYVYKNPRAEQLEFWREQRALLASERKETAERLTWLDQRIAEWDRLIEAIEPLVQNDPGLFLRQKGLAEICRMALDAYGDWVTAQQVRGYLSQLGITLDYPNPMAVLHTTLKRVGKVARDSFGNTIYASQRVADPTPHSTATPLTGFKTLSGPPNNPLIHTSKSAPQNTTAVTARHRLPRTAPISEPPNTGIPDLGPPDEHGTGFKRRK